MDLTLNDLKWLICHQTKYFNKQFDLFQQICFVLNYLFYFSLSSSYRAGSTDIPDPLSPLLPIVHRPR